MNRADEAAWREYVGVEIAKFYDHCDGTTYIWAHTPEADKTIARLTGTRTAVRYTDELGRERERFDYVGGDSELAAFSGPWHVIRKHLTTEFRQWVEEYEATERMTPTEWRAAQIAERAEVAFTESAEHTLGQLIELRRLTAERDALIVEAAQRGATKVSIAAAVGLSRQQIHSIVAASELAPVTPIRPDIASEEPAVELRRLASGEVVEVF